MKKLTEKEEAAAQSLLILKKKADAYRAHYKCDKMTAGAVNVEAHRLFERPHVAARVAELKKERSKRTGIDADYVLNQAVKLHERCMQEVKPKAYSDGTQIEDEDGNPLFEFNASGAASSLKLIGDHVGVQAFKKVVDVEVGAKKSLAELLQQAIADDSK